MKESEFSLPIKIQRHLLQKELYVQFAVDCIDTFKRYVDVLSDVVENYNSTPHRSLHGLSLNEVTKENEADVWARLYLKKIKRSGKQNTKKKKTKNRSISI